MATLVLNTFETRIKMADQNETNIISKLIHKNYCIWDRKTIVAFFKYLKILLLLELLGILVVSWPLSEARLLSKSRKTAFMPGDILMGTLVSVHHQPKQETASLLECGEIREQYGIQRVEAAFLAVDRINKDETLLPDITLGIEIRDSCWYPSIALEQSIEFIRDAITGPEGGNSSSPPASCAPKGPEHSPSSKNLVGVIGPGSSAVTIQVQNLLQLFRIPQIGYSATSKDLSDKSRFSYFLRVVPSDYYQAQVMVDIVKHYNWTYVSAVHTDGNYGQSGITAFRELAEMNNICIAKEDTVLGNAEEEEFDEVIRSLSEESRATVVVCFCEGMTIRHLLKATERLQKVRRFLFLGSDGWADRSDVVAGVEEAALGGLSVKIQSSYVTGFDEHYFSLRPDSNDRNPWFKEFWEYRFNCTFRNVNDSRNISHNSTYAPDGTLYCTGNEKLSEGYKQDTKMAFVVKATYTMAHGLHAMHRDICKGKPGLCREMSPINGSLFRDYLMKVNFSYLNENVNFDSRGDPPGRYDIMNFQKLSNGSYDYVKVATWDNGTLRVDEGLVVFNGSDKTPPISVCARPCNPGQSKSFVHMGDHRQTCCWFCIDCKDNQYLENETYCSPCAQDQWPNEYKTGCDPIPVEYIQWGDDVAIAALSVATLGFLCTCFVMIVFIKNNHTPVVKASTRELSYIIFVGMMVSYLSSLPLLHMPTQTTCTLTRILPGCSFSMIYAALVTKTNRIARILAGNKKIMIRKLKFMSATAQVMITCGLISIELGIILFMLIHQPSHAIKSYPKPGKVVTICNTTPMGIMAPMGWDFFLIILCTVYAVKTRNLPENFNEAKFIGFSMYTTCVIWLAWMAIYFGSNHKVICMSISTSLSAFVTLILLFFPKVYIILCRPERNDRSAFRTTTIRCHIGSGIKQTKGIQDQGPLSLVESPSCTSSVYTSADSKWTGLLLRVRGAIQQQNPQKRSTTQSTREHHPKALLKRETSTWSDVSVSPSSVAQHRGFLLQKAFGSQLGLDGENCRWSHGEKGTQTSDDLLDPLVPRMRRRVVRAVREGTLSKQEGKEFFDLTEDFLQSKENSSKRLAVLKEEEEQRITKQSPNTRNEIWATGEPTISSQNDCKEVPKSGFSFSRNLCPLNNMFYDQKIRSTVPSTSGSMGSKTNSQIRKKHDRTSTIAERLLTINKAKHSETNSLKIPNKSKKNCPTTLDTNGIIVVEKVNRESHHQSPEKCKVQRITFTPEEENEGNTNRIQKKEQYFKHDDRIMTTFVRNVSDTQINNGLKDEKSNSTTEGELGLRSKRNCGTNKDSLPMEDYKNEDESSHTLNELNKRRENELIILGILKKRSLSSGNKHFKQRQTIHPPVSSHFLRIPGKVHEPHLKAKSLDDPISTFSLSRSRRSFWKPKSDLDSSSNEHNYSSGLSDHKIKTRVNTYNDFETLPINSKKKSAENASLVKGDFAEPTNKFDSEPKGEPPDMELKLRTSENCPRFSPTQSDSSSEPEVLNPRNNLQNLDSDLHKFTTHPRKSAKRDSNIPQKVHFIDSKAPSIYSSDAKNIYSSLLLSQNTVLPTFDRDFVKPRTQFNNSASTHSPKSDSGITNEPNQSNSILSENSLDFREGSSESTNSGDSRDSTQIFESPQNSIDSVESGSFVTAESENNSGTDDASYATIRKSFTKKGIKSNRHPRKAKIL